MPIRVKTKKMDWGGWKKWVKIWFGAVVVASNSMIYNGLGIRTLNYQCHQNLPILPHRENRGRMFLFPYGTNAPIYYWPIMTVGMIAANILIFILELTQTRSSRVPPAGKLATGSIPTQWLTCNFMHADIFSFFWAIMICLWAFGWWSKGNWGPAKRVPFISGSALHMPAIVQILMLGAHPPYASVLSAVIYGSMAMSLIWAPEK